MEIKAGQQYRIASDGALLDILSIEGESASCSILRNNENKTGNLDLLTIKSEIGKGKLNLVSLHKAQNNSMNEDLMSSLVGMGYGSQQKKPSVKLKPGDRVIYTDYDNKRHKGTIGGADKKNGKTIYDVELDNGNLKWGHPEQFKKLNEINLKESISLYESKFGRISAQFNDFLSKVISILKRNNVDENQGLNIPLIATCEKEGMNSRECAMAYLKNINESKMIKEDFWQEPTPRKRDNEAELEKIVEQFLIDNYGDLEDQGFSIIHGGKEIIVKEKPSKYNTNNHSFKRKFSPEEQAKRDAGASEQWEEVAIELIRDLDNKGYSNFELAMVTKSGFRLSNDNLQESKKMGNKKQLNETSFTFNNTSKFILNYEDQDIVKGIKELFKDYEGFTCNKISAVGDSQFYNVEVTADIEDEFADIEAKRFVISQKVHKFRAEFFTDLSSIFPVVNINLGNYEFTKNDDKLKFSLTLLMSATNQRDWVSGEYKQKDKKLGQKILDSMEKKELTETIMNSKLKDLLK